MTCEEMHKMKSLNQIPTVDDYLKAPVHPLRQAGGHSSVVKREVDTQRPLVTVYTVVKNRKETLAQTILSVLNQTYPNIEYIVIDGASIDGTLEVIKQFDNKIGAWISEPDSGTSDAFNKAVSIAQGDFVFWLSSDDWIDPDFIEKAVQAFLKSGADFIFGDMIMYKDGETAILFRGDKDYAMSLMSGCLCFNYPSMIIKRRCFQNIGLFDLNYKHANDFEWLLRFHQSGGKGYYENTLIIHRRVGGVGESHPVQSALEHLRILRRYRLPKTKAIATYLHYLVRRRVGHCANLFLPGIIYKKLKRIVRRGY